MLFFKFSKHSDSLKNTQNHSRNMNFSIKMNIKKYTADIFLKKINKQYKHYNFKKFYPGTNSPGLVDENVPLVDLLKSEIINLNVQKFSRDKHCGTIRGSDENILEWLEKRGKLKVRLQQEDIKEDLIEKNPTILEDEFNFEDNEDTIENFFTHSDSKLIDFI